MPFQPCMLSIVALSLCAISATCLSTGSLEQTLTELVWG